MADRFDTDFLGMKIMFLRKKMPRFQHVRVYTYAGKIVYGQEDPLDLPTAGYSLVDIKPTPDGQGLSEITARFVYGTQDCEYAECVFTKELLICLGRYLCCGENESVVDCVSRYALQIQENACQILEATNVPGPQSGSHQRLLDTFAVGLGSYLGYLCLLGNDQVWQADPLPYYLRLPELTGLDSLHPAVFAYLEPSIQVVMAINDHEIGQLWLEQIVNFWHVWGPLFRKRECSINIAEGLMEAMKGLATYVGNVTGQLQSQYSDLNEELDQAQCKIAACRDEAISACRLQKQNQIAALQQERQEVLDEVDEKLLQWDKAVADALEKLQTIQSSSSYGIAGASSVEEFLHLKEDAVSTLEDLRTTAAEELAKVKEDCIVMVREQVDRLAQAKHKKDHRTKLAQLAKNFCEAFEADHHLRGKIIDQIQGQVYPLQCRLEEMDHQGVSHVGQAIDQPNQHDLYQMVVQSVNQHLQSTIQSTIQSEVHRAMSQINQQTTSRSNALTIQEVQQMVAQSINQQLPSMIGKEVHRAVAEAMMKNTASQRQHHETRTIVISGEGGSRQGGLRQEVEQLKEELVTLKGVVERLLHCLKVR